MFTKKKITNRILNLQITLLLIYVELVTTDDSLKHIIKNFAVRLVRLVSQSPWGDGFFFSHSFKGIYGG